jgi:hypothetical protein
MALPCRRKDSVWRRGNPPKSPFDKGGLHSARCSPPFGKGGRGGFAVARSSLRAVRARRTPEMRPRGAAPSNCRRVSALRVTIACAGHRCGWQAFARRRGNPPKSPFDKGGLHSARCSPPFGKGGRGGFAVARSALRAVRARRTPEMRPRGAAPSNCRRVSALRVTIACAGIGSAAAFPPFLQFSAAPRPPRLRVAPFLRAGPLSEPGETGPLTFGSAAEAADRSDLLSPRYRTGAREPCSSQVAYVSTRGQSRPMKPPGALSR